MHTCIHTCIHAYIHAYMHTCTQENVGLQSCTGDLDDLCHALHFKLADRETEKESYPDWESDV